MRLCGNLYKRTIRVFHTDSQKHALFLIEALTSKRRATEMVRECMLTIYISYQSGTIEATEIVNRVTCIETPPHSAPKNAISNIL